MAIDGLLTQGESQAFEFTITDEAGAATNLAGSVLRWGLAVETGSDLPVVQLTEVDMSIGGAGNNVVSFMLTPAETEALIGYYRHELQITDGAGHVYKPVFGILGFRPGINDPTP